MKTITHRAPQWTVFSDAGRFRVLVAGGKFGKTYLVSLSFIERPGLPAAWSITVAPTIIGQARYWNPLKEMTCQHWRSKPNETDLRIDLTSGGSICLRGADNYDSLRGAGLDFADPR